jgi:N,N'-diacetyllegionaminate synthase
MKNNNKTIIIAEAGVNHNGRIKLAKKMIVEASKSGADYIKFQLFSASEIATKNSSKALYAKQNYNKNISHFNMLKKFEFSFQEFVMLKNYCKKNKIKFLLSPFSIEDIKKIKKLNLKVVKLPSGEINNLPYLEFIGKLKKEIILSTGMSTLKEISSALNILINFGTKKKNISLLQCNTEYPTPFKDVNLLAIKELRKKFNLNVGYSDHTVGIEASIAAVAIGARIIEKHVTLNKTFIGPDHKASINFNEFSIMVNAIRNIEKSLGDGKKKITQSEKKNLNPIRKSIVAIKNIKKNETFDLKNISIKRPGNGISPMSWYKIIGQQAKRKYKKDDLIKKNEVQ